jgi:hypothetical protein
VEPTLEQEIRKGQIDDAKIQEIKDLMVEGRGPDFMEDDQGTIWFKNRKSKHQRPARLLHPLKVLEWRWEEIGMDFIVGLPHTPKGYDFIWVIVERLTKVAHFIPFKTTYKGSQLVELYMA